MHPATAFSDEPAADGRRDPENRPGSAASKRGAAAEV